MIVNPIKSNSNLSNYTWESSSCGSYQNSFEHPLVNRQIIVQESSLCRLAKKLTKVRDLTLKGSPYEIRAPITQTEVDYFMLGKRNSIIEKQLISSGGQASINGKIYRLIGLQKQGSSKLAGLIYYQIKKNPYSNFNAECKIRSLKIQKAEKHHGYGSILMSYAFMTAIQYQCSRLKLKTTQEGISFYLSWGFRPQVASIYESTWDVLDPIQQLAITQKLWDAIDDLNLILDIPLQKLGLYFNN